MVVMATVPNGTQLRKVKVAVIGDKHVGKTSLITRYVRNDFTPHYTYTQGGDMENVDVVINNNKVHLVLVDAAGHHYVRSLIKTLYRDVQAILIVFDITRENTFAAVKDWLNQIDQVNTNNPAIFLVGNKQDLKSHRKVKAEQAEMESQRLGMSYFETSARTGHNVKETFKALLKEAWKQTYTPEESITVTYDDIREKEPEEKSCCQVT